MTNSNNNNPKKNSFKNLSSSIQNNNNNKNKPHSKQKMICKCLNIPRENFECALQSGCTTIHEILDFTGAGIGPCGATCRKEIQKILDEYLKTNC